MTRKCVLVFCFAVLSLLLSTLNMFGSQVNVNVFLNSSFEEPVERPFPPSSNTFATWTVNPKLSASRPGTVTTVDDTVARTGNRSVQVHGTRVDGVAPQSTLRQYGRNLEGGATYRLEAWFKTDSEVKNPDEKPIYMRLRFYYPSSGSNIPIRDDLDTMILAPESPYYTNNGPNLFMVYPEAYDDEWNRLYVEFVAPEETDRLLMELFYGAIWHDGDEGTLWWDDVTLSRID